MAYWESFLLNELIKVESPQIVQYWAGPLGKTHDFESEFMNLEVKTTTKQPASVQISLIKQVAPMEGNKELHLVVVGLEKGEEISLVSIIEDIRKALSDTTYLTNFEHILMKSGYRNQDKVFYSKTYSISFVQSHKIMEDSPVLNPRIIGEIPSTVTNIRYTLEVHGMDMEDLSEEIWESFASKMGE